VSGYSALAECRTSLCTSNEHHQHERPCCAAMASGDCACDPVRYCCSCDDGSPCPEAWREAMEYLAFGGITHDLEDLLTPEHVDCYGCDATPLASAAVMRRLYADGGPKHLNVLVPFCTEGCYENALERGGMAQAAL
jgi:hypothetical protein